MPPKVRDYFRALEKIDLIQKTEENAVSKW